MCVAVDACAVSSKTTHLDVIGGINIQKTHKAPRLGAELFTIIFEVLFRSRRKELLLFRRALFRKTLC